MPKPRRSAAYIRASVANQRRRKARLKKRGSRSKKRRRRIELSPIVLNPRQSKQSKTATALDFISAPLSQPRTFFTKGPSAGARAVRQSREDIAAGRKSGFGVIGTTLLTAGTAGALVVNPVGVAAGARALATRTASGLGSRIAASPIKSALIGTITIPTVAGFVSTPTGKKIAKAIFSPSKNIERGKGIAGLIDNPPSTSGGGFGVKEALATAGIAGAGIFAGKKILDFIRGRRDGGGGGLQSISLPTGATGLVAGAGGAGSIASSGSAPLIEEPPKAEPVVQKAPTIKITNKPVINVAVAV